MASLLRVRLDPTAMSALPIRLILSNTLVWAPPPSPLAGLRLFELSPADGLHPANHSHGDLYHAIASR